MLVTSPSVFSWTDSDARGCDVQSRSSSLLAMSQPCGPPTAHRSRAAQKERREGRGRGTRKTAAASGKPLRVAGRVAGDAPGSDEDPEINWPSFPLPFPFATMLVRYNRHRGGAPWSQ